MQVQLGQGACACYWLEPTGMVALTLRRFTFSVPEGQESSKGKRNCPASERWGHNASSPEYARMRTRKRTMEDGYTVLQLVPKGRIPGHRDNRWPKVCDACGEPFQRGDQWQANQSEIYLRADTGAEVTIAAYPGPEHAGALYDAWWRHGYADGLYVGPDGIALHAVCPDGIAWEVDGPATGGGHWSRTGDPRNPPSLTCSPSIKTPTYHGFLQQGRFTDHIG